MKLFFVILACVLGTTSSQYSDCSESIITLETALYANGNNVLQLSRVFFPPGSSPPRFVSATYRFFNESNELDDCSVVYVWSTSGFLLFLPPNAFQWVALNFFYPDNELDELEIQLPYECRGLVNGSRSGNGSCVCDENGDTFLLTALTQQLQAYAMYNNRDSLVREHTKARSICLSNLEDSFYNKGVGKFVLTIAFTTLVFPVFCLFLAFVLIRSAHETVTKPLVEPENHSFLVALALTCLIFTILIFVHDIIASYVVLVQLRDYRRTVSSNTPHLEFVHVTLAIDIIFVLTLLAAWIYIIYCSVMEFLGKRRKVKLSPCFDKFLTVLLGKENCASLKKLSDNHVIAFVIPYMIIPTIFLAVSHIGYIVAAWLAEPHKGSITLLLVYIFVAYFLLVFKKCYNFHSKVVFSSHSKVESESSERRSSNYQMVDLTDSGDEQDSKPGEAKPKKSDSQNDTKNTDAEKPKPYTTWKVCGKFYIHHGIENGYINLQILLLSLVYGIFFIILAALALSVFVLIPSASEAISTYIVNLFHIVVILVTAQLSFKFFFSVNFDFDSFLNVFKERFSAKEETEANKVLISVVKSEAGTTELAGTLAAEFADAFFKKCSENKVNSAKE